MLYKPFSNKPPVTRAIPYDVPESAFPRGTRTQIVEKGNWGSQLGFDVLSRKQTNTLFAWMWS